MSIKTMTWAFSQPISGNEKVVLLALADFANDDGECWPSIPKIAEKAYLSVRTVQRIILILSDQGYMGFERRETKSGVPTSSKYRLFVGGDNLSPYGDKQGGGGDTVVTIYEPSLRTFTKPILSVSKETRPSKPKGYTQEFEEFWKTYPVDKLMSKAKTFQVWQKLTSQEQQLALASIPDFKAECAKQFKDYRTPHATTYLSQKRFEGFKPAPFDWTDILMLARRTGFWSVEGWGPKPFSAGCTVPPELLTEADNRDWKAVVR